LLVEGVKGQLDFSATVSSVLQVVFDVVIVEIDLSYFHLELGQLFGHGGGSLVEFLIVHGQDLEVAELLITKVGIQPCGKSLYSFKAELVGLMLTAHLLDLVLDAIDRCLLGAVLRVDQQLVVGELCL